MTNDRRLVGAPTRDVPHALVVSAAEALGVRPDAGSRVLVALAECMGGRAPEEVAGSLTWKEFEGFCSELLTASGLAVRENVYLSRPRAQIDLVATGPSFVLSVDCKHWRRDHSPSALLRFAVAQKRRSKLLRSRYPNAPPIVSAVLSFSAPGGTFVDGVAVVPLRALRSFLASMESYREFLELT